MWLGSWCHGTVRRRAGVLWLFAVSLHLTYGFAVGVLNAQTIPRRGYVRRCFSNCVVLGEMHVSLRLPFSSCFFQFLPLWVDIPLQHSSDLVENNSPYALWLARLPPLFTYVSRRRPSPCFASCRYVVSASLHDSATASLPVTRRCRVSAR